uniref:Uncharacterized protein n=1 Tax=Pseudomonas phage RVTF4 TaxID=3236931 RepID=A0AB39CD52_9VIRU
MIDVIKNKLIELGLIKSEFRKNIEQAMHDLELAADTMQHLIMSGRYAGRQMCLVAVRAARDGDITREAYHAVLDHMTQRIGHNESLHPWLRGRVEKGTHEHAELMRTGQLSIIKVGRQTMAQLDKDPELSLDWLDTRIILTNWYWREIRAMRDMAASYRRDLKTMNW